MVSVNVSQLLLAAPGTVREFDFEERFPDPDGELHLRGPLTGHARLMRMPESILVHLEHAESVILECARCLEEADADIEGAFDEEFVPSTDVHTGLPVALPDEDVERLTIDEHHMIDLDEVLRQNILTLLPLRPLCSAACPGLCPACGERLDRRHRVHAQATEDEAPVDPASPFAQLAVLLKDEQER
jgi:uncharacterized metal-binding protein YceD (DUF177 family)